ncbi:ATP-binding protein [Streptomyces jumonjinensis]|uniref:ATP-binding protein n=2 Tax=Streptomyces jumonjinensis TaxID=1945 RepID=A0A646KT73_STRJU|nr:ATP-binding protein [Streptomyces jumonjinensis]
MRVRSGHRPVPVTTSRDPPTTRRNSGVFFHPLSIVITFFAWRIRQEERPGALCSGPPVRGVWQCGPPRERSERPGGSAGERSHPSMETITLTPVIGGPAGHRRFWRLGREPSTVSAARRLIRRQLMEWAADELAEDASVITSELVTNALLHARGPIVLTVRLLPGTGAGVRIDVRDQGPCDGPGRTGIAPPASPPEHMETGGRGLHLVTCLAHDWGSVSGADGHTVWAVLRGPAGSPMSPCPKGSSSL